VDRTFDLGELAYNLRAHARLRRGAQRPGVADPERVADGAPTLSRI
jgi:hypothetical protein